jgi:L-lysine 2,3-aminomutase
MDPKEVKFVEEMLKKRDKGNRSVMTREDYYKTIAELQEAAGITTTKSSHQRHLLKRYEILACGQVSKLILKRKNETDQPKHVVFVEEMFHILQRVHIVSGHDGRDKMTKEASKKYANITEASIELFKSSCSSHCAHRARKNEEGLP